MTGIKVKNNYQQRALRRRRGATLLEFAFVVPILLAILLGIMEFGWMAKNKLQLANAVREAARDASVGIKTDNSDSATNSIEARLKSKAAGIPGVPSTLTIDLQRDDGDDSNGYNYDIQLGNKAADSNGNIYNDAAGGVLIRTRASLPHQSLTNFPFTQGRTLQVDVIMRREAGN